MLNVFLIDAEYLKSNSNLSGNIDDNKLRHSIYLAHVVNLQESLGQTLLEKIQLDISGGTLVAQYKELVDTYVLPMVTKYAEYYSLDALSIQLVNAGLQSFNTEQGSQIDIKTLQYIKSNTRDIAQVLDTNLTRYLGYYSAQYPEYLTILPAKVVAKTGPKYRLGLGTPRKNLDMSLYWTGRPADQGTPPHS